MLRAERHYPGNADDKMGRQRYKQYESDLPIRYGVLHSALFSFNNRLIIPSACQAITYASRHSS
jgi:hypothetical protein